MYQVECSRVPEYQVQQLIGPETREEEREIENHTRRLNDETYGFVARGLPPSPHHYTKTLSITIYTNVQIINQTTST